MENESQKRRKDIERAAQRYGALEFGSSALSGYPAEEVAVRAKYAPEYFIARDAAGTTGQALNERNQQVLVDDINQATAPEMKKLIRQQDAANPSLLRFIINALRGK